MKAADADPIVSQFLRQLPDKVDYNEILEAEGVSQEELAILDGLFLGLSTINFIFSDGINILISMAILFLGLLMIISRERIFKLLRSKFLGFAVLHGVMAALIVTGAQYSAQNLTYESEVLSSLVNAYADRAAYILWFIAAISFLIFVATQTAWVIIRKPKPPDVTVDSSGSITSSHKPH